MIQRKLLNEFLAKDSLYLHQFDTTAITNTDLR